MSWADNLKSRAAKLGVNPIDCATRKERLEMIRILGREGNKKAALDWWLSGGSRISQKSFMEALNG